MATDRRGASWLTRERLTTSKVDTDPKRYSGASPRELRTMRAAFGDEPQNPNLPKIDRKNLFKSLFTPGKQQKLSGRNWARQNVTGPVSDKLEDLSRRLPTYIGNIIKPDARRFAIRYGMSKSSGDYGSALAASDRRRRDIKRADKGIAKKY